MDNKYLEPVLNEAGRALAGKDLEITGGMREVEIPGGMQEDGSLYRSLIWGREKTGDHYYGETRYYDEIKLSIDLQGNITGFNGVNVSIKDPRWRQKLDDAIVNGVKSGKHEHEKGFTINTPGIG